MLRKTGATLRRLAWSRDRRKWFGMGLATKRIFHIGNAMKTCFQKARFSEVPKAWFLEGLVFGRPGFWKSWFS
jgi:hypothetical protein